VEKLENSYSVDANVKFCRHYGRVWRFLKTLNMEMPCGPPIPFQVREPKGEKIWT
jgi:hypothetical protein